MYVAEKDPRNTIREDMPRESYDRNSDGRLQCQYWQSNQMIIKWLADMVNSINQSA